MIPKIAPFLWFEEQAEEAAEFYVSVFNARPGSAGDSEILGVSRYGEAGPGKPGSAMTVAFRLEGQEFTGLNGGPHHSFTEAMLCGYEANTNVLSPIIHKRCRSNRTACSPGSIVALSTG